MDLRLKVSGVNPLPPPEKKEAKSNASVSETSSGKICLQGFAWALYGVENEWCVRIGANHKNVALG